MDNNRINKHINKNTVRSERTAQSRGVSDMDVVDKLLRREELPSMEQEHGKCKCHDPKCQGSQMGEIGKFDIDRLVCRNNSFREVLWTGRYLQTILMSIGRGGETGAELHTDSDQYIRVEHGTAMAITGERSDRMKEQCRLYAGEAIFIPAGMWHNIVNAGRGTLKLSSTYAPPQHI